MFFNERNIISSHSAGQTTTNSKKCESCTSGCWTPLDHSTWRRGGAAEFPEASPSESELCLFASLNSEQHFREMKELNSRQTLRNALDDEVPEFSTQAPLRCSKLLLSCHLTQQLPNFLLESLSKPAKTWQDSATWRHAWISWDSDISHSSPTPTSGSKECSDNWDMTLWDVCPCREPVLQLTWGWAISSYVVCEVRQPLGYFGDTSYWSPITFCTQSNIHQIGGQRERWDGGGILFSNLGFNLLHFKCVF